MAAAVSGAGGAGQPGGGGTGNNPFPDQNPVIVDEWTLKEQIILLEILLRTELVGSYWVRWLIFLNFNFNF